MVADVLAWFVFVGLTILGVTVTVVGTTHTYRKMRGDGKTPRATILTVAGAAIILFLGGWLFVAIYWLVTRALRAINRAEAGHTSGDRSAR
jgi:cell division protein FtsX